MSRLTLQLKKNIFLFACPSVVNGGNGGVKITMFKKSLILMGKKYVVQIHKRKEHTKNHIDWIKNEVTGEVQDPGDRYT